MIQGSGGIFRVGGQERFAGDGAHQQCAVLHQYGDGAVLWFGGLFHQQAVAAQQAGVHGQPGDTENEKGTAVAAVEK